MERYSRDMIAGGPRSSCLVRIVRAGNVLRTVDSFLRVGNVSLDGSYLLSSAPSLLNTQDMLILRFVSQFVTKACSWTSGSYFLRHLLFYITVLNRMMCKVMNQPSSINNKMIGIQFPIGLRACLSTALSIPALRLTRFSLH